MRDPRAAFVVEQVRGIFETLARARALVVPGRLNPRSVQYEMLGLKGKQLLRETVKLTAAAAVSRLYAQSLRRLGFDCGIDNLSRNQDIVDAMLVGGLALTRIKSAEAAGVSLEEYFDGNALRRRAGARRLQKRAAAAARTSRL